MYIECLFHGESQVDLRSIFPFNGSLRWRIGFQRTKPQRENFTPTRYRLVAQLPGDGNHPLAYSRQEKKSALQIDSGNRD